MAPNPIISQIYFFVTSHFRTLLRRGVKRGLTVLINHIYGSQRNLPAITTVVDERLSPHLLEALHSYIPLSIGKTSLMARIRPSSLNWARGMLVSPSLLHLTDGSGFPLTSHVKTACSPTAKMVLSGRYWPFQKNPCDISCKLSGVIFCECWSAHGYSLIFGSTLYSLMVMILSAMVSM